jgi:hypothetical protein
MPIPKHTHSKADLEETILPDNPKKVAIKIPK